MKWFWALYTNKRLYKALIGLIIVFILGFPYPIFFALGKALLLLLSIILLTDFIMLFAVKKGLNGERVLSERFSNGDDNEVVIEIENYFKFTANIQIIDEAPIQFQMRDFLLELQVPANKKRQIKYWLRPVKRGEYLFGTLNIYVTGPIGLLSRRFRFSKDAIIPVYPSYLQMRKYELMAISNRLTEFGVKKIRRIGHNMEFDQIREYVRGDDYRAINWKATARRNDLMVNQYQDERSQQVYCIIDKGRSMQMPFEGMSLLDYAINASLILSNIAIQKQDKAGVLTFNKKAKTFLKASGRPTQMNTIMEALYREKTAFKESDFERMYITVKHRLTQRSLLMLFTNFESLASLERQMKYLRGLSKSHVLVVIFFENTELRELREMQPKDTEGIYIQTIAEKLAYEKRRIVKELTQYGIFPIFTAPQDLTANTINKYLEMKARGMI